MASPFDPLALENEDNPFVTAGMRRRAARAAASTDGPVRLEAASDSWGDQTVRAQAINLASYGPALSGLARKLVGDDAGAREDFDRYNASQQRVRERGPQIQTMDDAAAAGGGASDYAAFAGYQAAAFLPDMAASLTGAGTGAVIGKQVAKGMVRRAVADQVEKRAVNVAKRDLAVRQAGVDAAKAATTASSGPEAVSSAVRVAQAQAKEAARKEAMAVAARVAGRTPLVDKAAKAASVAGAGAGQFPGMNTANVEILSREDSDQSDALKALAGTTAASALGALPAERFLSRFGAEATDAVRKQAQRLIPRIAKESGKQGLAEGSTEVLQEATQLASHKWIDQNIDLLSPENLDRYLASFVGGVLAGGTIGGGAEGVRAAGDALRGAGDAGTGRSRQLWAAVRDRLGRTGDALREKYDAANPRYKPGDVVPSDDVEVASGGAGAAFAKAKAGLGNIASKFRDYYEGEQRDDALDSDTDELTDYVERLHGDFEAGAETIGPEATRYTNPTPMASKRQDLLMRAVPRENAIWGIEDAARNVGAVLEKISRREALSDGDRRVLDALVDAPNGISKNTLRLIQAAGPELDRLDTQSEATADEDEPAGPMADAMRAAQARQAENQAEGDSLEVEDTTDEDTRFSNTMSERDALPGQLPTDRLLSLRKTAVEAKARAARGWDSTTSKESQDARKAFEDERNAQRYKLLDDSNSTFTKNNKAAAQYEERLKSPAYVEAVDPKPIELRNGNVMHQPQLIDLSTLMIQARGQNRSAGEVNKDGEVDGPAMFLDALERLAILGIKVKPETFTPGPIVNKKTGEVLTTLYDGRTQERPATNAVDINLINLGPNRAKMPATPTTIEPSGYEPDAPLSPREVQQAMSDALNGRKEKAQGEDLGDSFDDDAHKLIPRDAPPGEIARGAEGFVSSESVVADADATDPYADVVNAARAKVRDGADKDAAAFEAGVAIGEAEIAKQREGGLSERGAAVALRKLRNPESGVAARYFQRAVKHAFVRAHVRHAKQDTAARTDYDDSERGEASGSAVPVAKRAQESNKDFDLALQDELSPLAQQEGDGSNDPMHDEWLDDNAFDDIADSNDEGGHDHAKEAGIVNGILKALGFKTKFKWSVGGDVRRGQEYGGGASVDRAHIRLGDRLSGAERIEVLLHETGHAVIASHIGKLLGRDPRTLVASDGSALMGDQWMDLLAEVDPELHAALSADYDAYLAQVDPNGTILAARAGRSPMHRMEGMAARRSGSGRLRDSDKAAYVVSMNEWLADHLARAFAQKGETQGVIGKFFRDLADVLRRAYAALTGGEKAKWAPAPSVEAWVQSMLDANRVAATAVLRQPQSVASAERATVAAVAARLMQTAPAAQTSREDIEAVMAFVRDRLPKQERQILDRVLSGQEITVRLRQVFANQPDLLALLDDAKVGLEGRIALAFVAGLKGQLQRTGPRARSLLTGLGDDLRSLAGVAGDGVFAQRIFDDMADGTIERLRARGVDYDIRKMEARGRGALQANVNAIGDAWDKVATPFSKVFEGKFARARDSGIPAYRAIAALLQKPGGAVSEDRGMIPAVRDRLAKTIGAARRAFDGLDVQQQHRALTILQRGGIGLERAPAGVQQAVRQIRALMDDHWNYLHAAGAAPGKVQDYFPVMLDLRNERAATQLGEVLTRVLTNPEAEAEVRAFFGGEDSDGLWVPDTQTPLADLVQNLVDGARSEPGDWIPKPADGPKAKPLNKRSMAFVYKYGSDADIKAFAKLQLKDAPELFARYFEPTIKHAEYVRRFGRNGEVRTNLIDTMRRQGATEDDVNEASNMIDAAAGVYGADGSPVLKMISPALAKRLSGRKALAVTHGLQAYQNSRLLWLSTLSSLVDPMGIAVRSGGDFATAWAGFKTGIKSLYDKSTKDEIKEMLAQLGAADDMMTMEALHDRFGGAGNAFARRVNEFVFKWNGLGAWTRATRYMALESGHRFLIKHSAAAGDKSLRYLTELGVQPGDLFLDPDNPNHLLLLTEAERAAAPEAVRAADDRVRAALMQFVDEAILRPNAQQTPMWHSDPYMGLVTQYKSFGYAIFDQIGGRIGREMRHGNPMVLLPTMAYLPVVLMAELMREFLQYGSEGNPKRKNWTAQEYGFLAFERSGFITPGADTAIDVWRDVHSGRTAGSSQLGPTGGQLRDASHQRAGRTFEKALPGQVIYSHWNDEEAADVSDEAA
jgi:hypothetical protein